MYSKKEKDNLHQNSDQDPDKVILFLRELSQKVDDWFARTFSQQNSGKLISLVGGIAGAAWLASGIYIVDEGNRAVVTRFGAYQDTTSPGPHWHLPVPIESATIVNVANQRFIEVGYRSGGKRGRAGSIPSEALMLTEDENIVDVRLAVQYQIKDARDYLFSVRDPLGTLKQATQSAERAVIGKNDMDFLLTEGRSLVVQRIKETVQKTMDAYGVGIMITSVNLQDAQPPEQVQAAFQDAIKAREDKQRLINEAEGYANEVIPKARGEAARRFQEAEAYKKSVTSRANGDISRFNQLYAEFKKAPEVTRKRLQIEAMETVYSGTEIVMLDSGQQGDNKLLYLPLDKMGGHRYANNHAGNASEGKPATTRTASKTAASSRAFRRPVRGGRN